VVYIKRCGGSKYADLLKMFVDYGAASRALNVVIRARMAAAMGLDLTMLKVAYAYWWNRTQYLESYRKSTFGQLSTRKHLDAGKKSILDLLNSGYTAEQIQEKYGKFMDLVNGLAAKSELDDDEIRKIFQGEEVTRNYD